jgi:hypothetical protein
VQVNATLTPLAAATAMCNARLVRWLLARPEVDPNAMAPGVPRGMIALPLTNALITLHDDLYASASLEAWSCFGALMAHPRINVNAADADGSPPLHTLLSTPSMSSAQLRSLGGVPRRRRGQAGGGCCRPCVVACRRLCQVRLQPLQQELAAEGGGGVGGAISGGHVAIRVSSDGRVAGGRVAIDYSVPAHPGDVVLGTVLDSQVRGVCASSPRIPGLRCAV